MKKQQTIIEVNGLKISTELIEQLKTLANKAELEGMKNYLFETLNMMATVAAKDDSLMPDLARYSEASHFIYQFLNSIDTLEVVDREY